MHNVISIVLYIAPLVGVRIRLTIISSTYRCFNVYLIIIRYVTSIESVTARAGDLLSYYCYAVRLFLHKYDDASLSSRDSLLMYIRHTFVGCLLGPTWRRKTYSAHDIVLGRPGQLTYSRVAALYAALQVF